jgi:hypothetical protein
MAEQQKASFERSIRELTARKQEDAEKFATLEQRRKVSVDRSYASA